MKRILDLEVKSKRLSVMLNMPKLEQIHWDCTKLLIGEHCESSGLQILLIVAFVDVESAFNINKFCKSSLIFMGIN